MITKIKNKIFYYIVIKSNYSSIMIKFFESVKYSCTPSNNMSFFLPCSTQEIESKIDLKKYSIYFDCLLSDIINFERAWIGIKMGIQHIIKICKKKENISK